MTTSRRALAWWVLVAALVAALMLIDPTSSPGPSWLAPSSWGRWWAHIPPERAAFALVRQAALVCGWYLLGLGALSVLARRTGWSRSSRLLRRLCPPSLHHFVLGSLGLVATAGITLSAASAEAGASSPPGPEPPVLRSLPPPTTPATEGGSAPPVLHPAGSKGSPSSTPPPSTAAPSTTTSPPTTTVPLTEPTTTEPTTTEPTTTAPTTSPPATTSPPPPPPTPAQPAAPTTAGPATPTTLAPTTQPPPTTTPQPATTPPPATPLSPPSPPPATWTVQSGDSLWSIADATLRAADGSTPTDDRVAEYWTGLIAANRPALPYPDDPSLIFPGDTIILPPVEGGT